MNLNSQRKVTPPKIERMIQMEELIKTFKRSNGSIAVDGRDLHDFLASKDVYPQVERLTLLS